MALLIAGAACISVDTLKIDDLLEGVPTVTGGTAFTLQDGDWLEEFQGQFTYAGGELSGGTVTGWKESFKGQVVFEVSGFSVPVSTFVGWVETNDNEAARSTILGGADTITGSAAADVMRGYAGDDIIRGGEGTNYLRGDEGNDSLAGGAGQNLVYGNLGADTCEGGDGNDVVRGGQDNDLINGGGGADYVSGDKGSDTVTGGAGADIFHTFGDAGVDRVTDFSLAEGDRVQVDPGTQYTVSQVGADTVISMTGGGQMTLVGVQMSSLTAGWIFGA